ncbi:MAG: hypothetical protein ACM3PE_12435 [Deltaproteobacteria bacterium]
MNFDREQFADLLRLAKGDRSINRYGVAAGVDPGYISRLMRGLVANAPSASVINRLAAAAENKVEAADLMRAAGYLAPTEPVYSSPTRAEDALHEWEKVIEEAARYNITPEVAAELIRSVGQSLKKIRK